MTIKSTLNEFMIIHNKTIQEISKETSIDDSVLYDYVNGSIPKLKHAVTLANYMDCSLNYLMGLEDNPKEFPFKKEYDISVFAKRYDELLSRFNISHYFLSKEYGLNYSSHYSWRRGATPSLNSLVIIAKYFDVSIDFLIGRSC